MKQNPCIVLAIDPGETSGFAIFNHVGALVMSGQCASDQADRRLMATQLAMKLADSRVDLPLLIAREKWSAGGPNATPAMFAGLGSRWGWWEESIRIARHLSDSTSKVVFVQVFTQTWWAATMGGRKPKRDAALDLLVRRKGAVYHKDFGDDEAVAVAIGEWALRSPAAAKGLPVSAWKAVGDWIPRSR